MLQPSSALPWLQGKKVAFGYRSYFSWDYPGGSVVKNPPANAGNMSLILGSGGFPEEGNGYPLHYSYLENPMDRGAWWVQSMESQRVGHD